MAEQFVQLLVNGLITGAILALTGVGASLVFGIQRMANFAHSDYLTIGAYVAFVVNVVFHQSLLLAAFSGMLATAGFALVAHFGLFRPQAPGADPRRGPRRHRWTPAGVADQRVQSNRLRADLYFSMRI